MSRRSFHTKFIIMKLSNNSTNKNCDLSLNNPLSHQPDTLDTSNSTASTTHIRQFDLGLCHSIVNWREWESGILIASPCICMSQFAHDDSFWLVELLMIRQPNCRDDNSHSVPGHRIVAAPPTPILPKFSNSNWTDWEPYFHFDTFAAHFNNSSFAMHNLWATEGEQQNSQVILQLHQTKWLCRECQNNSVL